MSVNPAKRVVTKAGCETRPTQRSVTARLRNKSFVGG